MVSTGISVDWDYFVPEDPRWDIQHAETMLHLDLIWQTRSFLVDRMKTSGEEIGFWEWLKSSAGIVDCVIDVSESHVHIMKTILHRVERVILFDQHHDCWPYEDEEEIMCHNWGSCWLADNEKREIIWVYPEHSNRKFLPKPESKRLKMVPRKEFDWGNFEDSNISFIHACRSGCWTPPWLDEKFIDFIELSGFKKNNLEEDELWNPMEQRWDDIPKMVEVLHKQEKLVEKLKKGMFEKNYQTKLKQKI